MPQSTTNTAHGSIYPAVFVGLLLCAAGLLWPHAESDRPLTVAINIWPGVEGVLTARDDGGIGAERINFVEMSWSSAAKGAFHRRVVDATVVTLDELLRLEAGGAQPRVVLVLGLSCGSDAILARPGLHSLKECRGKRVGLELRSAGEYMLAHALQTVGLTLQDVEIVPLNLAETETAYDERDLDVVVTSDPWRVRIQDKGAVTLYDSSMMQKELSRVLVVREDALHNHPDGVRRLIAAHLNHITESGRLKIEHGLGAVLRREEISRQQWNRCLDLILLPNARENLQLMSKGENSLHDTLREMSRIMHEAGMLPFETPAEHLMIPDLIKEDAP